LNEDDWPFQGLVIDDRDQALLPQAEQKLAVQFVLANPALALGSVAYRHRLTWGDDSLGIDWTLGTAPAEWRDGLPDASTAGMIANAAYAVVVVGAVTGALAVWRRPGLPWLLLVLTYLLAVFDISEGNSRYHMPALGLLAVLCGGVVDAPTT
jgi:hypothetical protein